MGTPAANQFEEVLSERFPGIRFGRVNCRKIGDSSYWSQHSWNNGRDVYPPTSLQYLTSNDGDYRAYLDEVWEFVVANAGALNVRVRLWQVKNHYNHIHIDFWPRGWSTPPCAGGVPRYKYPDGSVEYTAQLINTYTEDEMNLEAYVNAAFDSGNPAVQGDRNYWLGLAQTNPKSPAWYDLFRAVMVPVPIKCACSYQLDGDST